MHVSDSFFTFLVLILVQLSSSLFLWEPRTLKCENRECFLLKNEKEGLKLADCVEDSETRHTCDIECDGADRDSVISKKPTDFRLCNRFYTYNTQKTASGKWLMWRSGECAKTNITMTVHCAFPLIGE